MKRRTFLIALGALLAGCATTSHLSAPPFSSDRISVDVRGTGPDVVLIHGLGSSTRVWSDTVAAVPGHRYHLVQIKGFAGQPAGANAGGAVVAQTAEEVARYIREARLSRPAVIGHSMGGTIALSLAARHDLLSKVMVVDMVPFLGALFGPPGTTAETVRPTADRLRDQALAATPETRRQNVEASMKTMVLSDARRQPAIDDALASDRAVTASAYHELIVTDLRPELPRIGVPVTVLHVQTPNLPLTAEQFDAFYRAAYSGLPNVTIRRIPDSYHFIMYDQPDRFAAELKAFLAG
jgi:pimeloyl-ACP methyl ester carboxylesterase